MLERDSVTAYLPGWPRSAAAPAAPLTTKSGSPVEIARRQEASAKSFSSASTFWPNCGAERRQPLADRRETRLGLGGSPAPARVKSRW